ncbi:hypothetical protein V1511DRAFT_508408 [Dipodascopsis uninucleata]
MTTGIQQMKQQSQQQQSSSQSQTKVTVPNPTAGQLQKPDKPRPHVCTTCLRAFARLEHLKRHERSHTKEKPFECPVCERRFARRDLLLRHQQKLHTGLPTTRQRQQRKNSITVATLGRPKKSSITPTARPRANTFSGVSAPPTHLQSESPSDSAALTNSWLESTFGGRSNTAFESSSSPIGQNGNAMDTNMNMFGSLFINPDLISFNLPDNKALGLISSDEDAVDFDEDYFWLSSLSITSPIEPAINADNDAQSATVSNNSNTYGLHSMDTPLPTSIDDYTSSGLNLSYSFNDQGPQQITHTQTEQAVNGTTMALSPSDIMSRTQTQTKSYPQQRSSISMETTVSPSSLVLDHNNNFTRFDSLEAQPSPTPSMTSTTSFSSSSSLNTSPPSDHTSQPTMVRGRPKPGDNRHAQQMLLTTLSARNALAQEYSNTRSAYETSSVDFSSAAGIDESPFSPLLHPFSGIF